MNVYILTRGNQVKVLGAETPWKGHLYLTEQDRIDLFRAGWIVKTISVPTPNSMSDLRSNIRDICDEK